MVCGWSLAVFWNALENEEVSFSISSHKEEDSDPIFQHGLCYMLACMLYVLSLSHSTNYYITTYSVMYPQRIHELLARSVFYQSRS